MSEPEAQDTVTWLVPSLMTLAGAIVGGLVFHLLAQRRERDQRAAELRRRIFSLNAEFGAVCVALAAVLKNRHTVAREAATTVGTDATERNARLAEIQLRANELQTRLLTLWGELHPIDDNPIAWKFRLEMKSVLVFGEQANISFLEDAQEQNQCSPSPDYQINAMEATMKAAKEFLMEFPEATDPKRS